MYRFFELQTQLEIANNLEYIQQKRFRKLHEFSRKIVKTLSNFNRSLK
ncbi:four helix bundle protein [Polaribacter sp. R77954]